MKIFKKGYPTIIHHTHRQNFLRVLEYLKLDIQTLDTYMYFEISFSASK